MRKRECIRKIYTKLRRAIRCPYDCGMTEYGLHLETIAHTMHRTSCGGPTRKCWELERGCVRMTRFRCSRCRQGHALPRFLPDKLCTQTFLYLIIVCIKDDVAGLNIFYAGSRFLSKR